VLGIEVVVAEAFFVLVVTFVDHEMVLGWAGSCWLEKMDLIVSVGPVVRCSITQKPWGTISDRGGCFDAGAVVIEVVFAPAGVLMGETPHQAWALLLLPDVASEQPIVGVVVRVAIIVLVSSTMVRMMQ
jgi:hypothetical protein